MARSGKRAPGQIEVIDLGEKTADIVAVLRDALGRAQRGELTGVMVVLETPEGGFRCAVSGSSNVAERVGRLELLKDMVIEYAFEDDDIDYSAVQQRGKK